MTKQAAFARLIQIQGEIEAGQHGDCGLVGEVVDILIAIVSASKPAAQTGPQTTAQAPATDAQPNAAQAAAASPEDDETPPAT